MQRKTDDKAGRKQGRMKPACKNMMFSNQGTFDTAIILQLKQQIDHTKGNCNYKTVKIAHRIYGILKVLEGQIETLKIAVPVHKSV